MEPHRCRCGSTGRTPGPTVGTPRPVEWHAPSSSAPRRHRLPPTPSPKSGSDVPDEDEVALVALGPGYPHDAKATTSEATTAAGEILASRGAGARTNQNMLVFLVADHLRLAELTTAVREHLAWSSI